jgi:type IV pilus assembly protein PilM
MAQRIVGLDIGTSAIRAVELTLGEGRPVLEKYGQVGLTPGMVVGGEVRDHVGVVAAIQRLWREGGFSEKRVIIGVAGLRAITRELDMPTLPPDELNDAVRFQADELIPFPMDQTSLSSQVIAQFQNAEGAPTLRVLVAAAHRELIDAVVGAATAAGLRPVGVDLNTAALVRALHDPTFTGGPEAIVSVGAGLTLVVVHEDGVLQFVRTIDLGGETTTRAIASALDLPVSDAEGVKRRLGQPGPSDDRAMSATSQAVDELVTEIHNSIRFFASLPGRQPVARVLVTGAAASTVGFLEKLGQGLDSPVILASPLSAVDASRLEISPEQAAAINPTLAVPVGLALPDPSGRPFNLLPREVAEKASERVIRRNLIIVAAAVVLIIIGVSVLEVFRVHSVQNTNTALISQNNYTKNVTIPKYDKYQVLHNNVAAQQLAIRPLVASEVDWLTVLNQIGTYLPPTLGYTLQTTFANLTLTAASAPGTSSAAGGAAPGALPSASQLIGSVSGSVTGDGVPSATGFGDSLSLAPGLENISISGSLVPDPLGNVTFSTAFDINGNCHSQRLATYTVPIPTKPQ